MDRLELALRRYRQIVPQAVGPLDFPLRDVRIWLAEDVCPVLEDFAARPTFREYASWPIRILGRSAETPERALIERVDEELRVCGKALVQLTRGQFFLRKLEELYPPRVETVAGEVEIAGTGLLRNSVRPALVNHLEQELAQVAAIGRRDWEDLVNVNDYFEPQQEWVAARNGQRVQRGDWIVSVNPELLPIGNFVVRCLLKRIEMRLEILKSLRRKCQVALRQIQGKYAKQRAALTVGWNKLAQSITEIEELFRTGPEVRLRDACAVLTQVYLAFHPKPDVAWLGLDPGIVEQGQVTIHARLTQRQSANMLDRAAAALSDLRHIFPEGSRQTAIEEAIASGGLVIVQGRGEVYWEVNLVADQLGRIQWKFLLALASKARLRAAVGISDVYSSNKTTSDSALATVWGRLKLELPPSLWKLVNPGPKARTYRLDLEPQRIHIFT